MSECAYTAYFGDPYVAQVVFSVVFATVLPYCILTLSIFIRKRKKQPMVARPFRTTVAGFIFKMLWISELCFRYIVPEGHSCFWFLILGWPLLGIALNIYLSRVWLLWFKFKSTQEKSTLPPLLNVSFNLSSLRTIKTRVRTYTGTLRGSTSTSPIAAGGSSSNEVAKVEMPSAGETTRGAQTNAPKFRRASTVTFSPSVDFLDSGTSSVVDTLVDSTDVRDKEFDASAEDSYNHAPTTLTGTLLHNENKREAMVSPSSHSHERDIAVACVSPSHSRSDAVTLTRVELCRTHGGRPSSVQGDTGSRIGSIESQISFADDQVAVPAGSPQRTTPLSRSRRSESYISNDSRCAQMMNPVQGADDRCVYVHISNGSTAAEPSSTSSVTDFKSAAAAAPATRRSISDKMVPPPTFEAGSASATLPAASTPRGQTPINWYLNHKHYGSDRFILRWFGLKTLIEWLVLMAPVYSSSGAIFREHVDGDCFCPSLIWALYAFQAILGYHALIVGYAAWRFAQIKDGFYLKTEFKFISIVCLVGIIVWNALTILPANNEVFPFGNLCLILVTAAVFSISSLYPLLMSSKRGMRSLRSLRSVSSSQLSKTTPTVGGCNSALHSFLTETDGGIQEFAEHLQREFSIENLLFWQAVEQYHTEFNAQQPKANQKLAVEIESRFINDQSELQVNLDSTDYRSVHEGIANNKITVDLFDTASSHIFRLMATDSFVRFRNQRNE